MSSSNLYRCPVHSLVTSACRTDAGECRLRDRRGRRCRRPLELVARINLAAPSVELVERPPAPIKAQAPLF